ncbi:cyclophilin-like fold protein [Streptomyces sp. DSM 3412]|uniref:Cyclophilin-like fold protein n=1 Tax=Streptomyces gottesmaniae TaxID=3075518 RepID=A0ABU2YWW3_9ACTN|nr:cyclophilin-like fold protein [Streptomyces sp. DSM 3412]MDT0567692.1 cyclophilin-like fold protein [Streptomyces sp. DSM 3412]
MHSAVHRNLVRIAPAATLLLAVAACSSDSPDAAPSRSSSVSAPAGRETAASDAPSAAPASPSSASSRSTAMDIRVTLDGRSVEATLNDSPAARDFAELLPLTLDLEDFHGTERVADLPRALDTSGAPEPAAARTGDIAYYAPWGNLALFYRDGPAASADLLILGHLDVGADQLGRAARITLEAAP